MPLVTKTGRARVNAAVEKSWDISVCSWGTGVGDSLTLRSSTGPVNAATPGSIIPQLPPVPGPPNWTSTIYVQGNPHTVAAGSYIYSNQSGALISGDSSYRAPLINEGTLWMDGTIPANVHSPHWQYTMTGSVDIINRGIAVVLAHDDAPHVGQSDAFVFFRFHEIENSGQIFAWAETGRAFALWSEDIPKIVNRGLIAAYVDTGLATTIHLANGGAIVNQVGGRILAEGPVATAISYYNASLPAYAGYVYQVENAGLIQAHSTNVNNASVAIRVAHASFQIFRLLNSGTISAEVAFIDESSTAGGYSPTQYSSQILTNTASGVINGDILLDAGDDELNNSGTINGDVLLGTGNDKYDTSAGTATGLVDLGLGTDTFKGSAGADYVAGDMGDDLMEGNAGNDQLMGGANNDTLIGGTGNDGLFGEYGNDRIVTRGGDFVWGGYGDDRIELGDYTFELVSGNEGFDTLVLPGGARIFDLSLALAENALSDFERIVLGGGKELVVRAADIAPITGGGHILRLDGSASDKVDLIGAWSAGAIETFDGTSYRRYDLGAETVFVSTTATTSVQATGPAGAMGLDPFAGGPLAPVPGDGPLDFTPNERYAVDYRPGQTLTITPEQVWWNDVGFPVFNGADIINYGLIENTNDQFTSGGAVGTATLQNYGVVRTAWLYTDIGGFNELALGGMTAVSHGNVVNHGLIEALAIHGAAIGLEGRMVATNLGEVRAYSEFGWAVGANELDLLVNKGTITAIGGVAATGVRHFAGNAAANEGRIEADVTGASGESIGVLLRPINGSYVFTYTNSGIIVADLAIKEEQSNYSGYVAIKLENSGTLIGRLELSLSGDTVINSGSISGNVLLLGGDDVFQGSIGSQSGLIDGGSGDDILTGGAGADLLKGGLGADTLDGKAGSDQFIYQAAGESVNGAMDRIRNFQSSLDRIDLRDVMPTSVSWVQQTDSSDNSLYNLVSVVTAGGTMQIRVDGALTMSDFILETGRTLLGTPDPDILLGGSGDDFIDGRGAADRMEGGGGNDSYFVDDAGDLVVEAAGEGFDRVYTSASYSLGGGVSVEFLAAADAASAVALNLIGNEFAQQIFGNSGANRLAGGGGADALYGGTGDDHSFGEDGDDLIGDGEGADYADGGLGNDYIYTGLGADQLYGGAGNDFLFGQDGDDLIGGGEGVDYVEGGAGSDYIYTGAGGDRIIGGAGDDQLFGEGENDVIGGDDGADYIEGGEGNDYIYAGLGVDRIIGGLGNDNLLGEDGDDVIGGDAGVDYLDGGEGNDYLYGGGDTDDVQGGGGNDVLLGEGGDDRLGGGVGDDLLFGQEGADLLGGGDGADYADGGAGNDYLFTGLGADQLYGGGGDDLLFGQEGDDLIGDGEGADYAEGGAGNDFIYLGGGNDRSFGGEGADQLFGQDGDDVLGGEAGNDYIEGGAGNDFIYGGAGVDILIGGSGADSFAFVAAPGLANLQQIVDFAPGADKLLLDRAAFAALAPGSLPAGAFALGTAAADADDRIVYDAASGKLYYDADGAGGAAAIHFATLSTNLALTPTDFITF